MLPATNSFLRVLSPRVFNKDVTAVHHRIRTSTTEALMTGEIVLVLHAQYAAGGSPMVNQMHFMQLLVASSKGIGWIISLSTTAHTAWMELA